MKAINFSATVLSVLMLASAVRGADVSEDLLMRHSDAREARDRVLMAELAHARATNQLDQARFMFDLDSRLYQARALPRLTLLESQVKLRQSQIADRMAHQAKDAATIEEKIQLLRASWRSGSQSDLPALAKLLVEKRALRVRMLEANLVDFSDISKAKGEIYEMNKEALETNAISKEETQLSYFNARQAVEDVAITGRDLDFAKTALADANRDLDAASRN